MKEDLLGVLAQLEPESIDTAELMVKAMSSVTNNVDELSSKAQVCQLLFPVEYLTGFTTFEPSILSQSSQQIGSAVVRAR